MSEAAYQVAMKNVDNDMQKEGFTLSSKGIQGGYFDSEYYKYSNENNETVEFTVKVHRSDNDGLVFIDEAYIDGCSTSNASDYEKYCGQYGRPKRILEASKINDVEGSHISPGKTVGAVLLGSFSISVFLGVLLGIAESNSRY